MQCLLFKLRYLCDVCVAMAVYVYQLRDVDLGDYGAHEFPNLRKSAFAFDEHAGILGISA
jgi:hypothetical protein